jgi:hypothetical protein
MLRNDMADPCGGAAMPAVRSGRLRDATQWIVNADVRPAVEGAVVCGTRSRRDDAAIAACRRTRDGFVTHNLTNGPPIYGVQHARDDMSAMFEEHAT